jgi:hypothetical protein
MDKVAYYKEVIYKEAMARAWKKVVGNLSDDAISKLTSKGILNHERELAGLNKGTENIIKSKGGKAISGFSDDQLADAALGIAQSNHYVKDLMKSLGVDSDSMRDAFKDAAKTNSGFMTLFDPNGNGGFVHRGNIEKLPKNINKALGTRLALPKKQLDRDFTEAVINRHEANELSHASNIIKKNKKAVVEYKGQKIPVANAASHITPKVIANESANVAIAPKETKKFMAAMRDATGELEGYNDLGLNYGKSGQYSKSTGAKLQRAVVAENKPDILKDIKDFKKSGF